MSTRSSSNRLFSTSFVRLLFAMLTLSCSAIAQSARKPTGSFDVLTYHYDTLRSGWFQGEVYLNTSNVNAQQFGRLFTTNLDGRVDGEPLYVYQLQLGKLGVHNMVYVVTENNSLYAIDGDSGAILGHRNFGTPVPWKYKNNDDNVFPVQGILGTPVIDRTLGNIYFVVDTYNGTLDTFRLHAVSISTLKDVVTPASIRLSAKMSDGSIWKFNPKYHLQRPALLEANGSIYVAFGSNGDTQPDQSRGNIMRFDATTLAFLGSDITNTLSTPSSPYYLSSIWQSGFGPAADANGDIYFATGNSNPGQASYSASFNRPDSTVHLSGDLTSLIDSFTTYNYYQLDQSDLDVGSGGAMLLPDQPGSMPHLAAQGGKDGRTFLMNRDNLGGFTQNGPDNVLQTVAAGGCWCGPAYYTDSTGTGHILTGASKSVIDWKLQTSPTLQLVEGTLVGTGVTNGLPDNGGTFPIVSSNGTTAGSAILWFVQRPQYQTDTNPGAPVTLYAYDATNLTHQLFSSQAGTFIHAVDSNANIVPTVANGKVYVASNMQLQAFGLLSAGARSAPVPRALEPSKEELLSCTTSEPLKASLAAGATSHRLYGRVCQVDGTSLKLALRSGHTVSLDITHAYDGQVRHVLLTSGRYIKAEVSVEKNGTGQVTRISPRHPFSAATPADR